MRRTLGWALALALTAICGLPSPALAAKDPHFDSLRRLQAPAPTTPPPLPVTAKPKSVNFAKIVIHPRDGEPWALIYTTFMLYPEDAVIPPDKLLTWDAGRVGGNPDAYGQAFNEELRKAGFKGEAEESLFEERGSSDLRIGVLVDDIKGRFCANCPNMFQRKDKTTAVVTMNARWELYSASRAAVIAKVTTSGGTTWDHAPNDSVFPVVLDAFRENVRQLLASDEFRKAVTSSDDPAPARLAPITFTPTPTAKSPIAAAPSSVAMVVAGDSMGTAFLISPDGYLLTNHHVVRESTRVRVRWSDMSETVGQVLRSDRRRDVALIKVEARGRSALPLRTGPIQVGETVLAIGTPLDEGLQSTVTRGVVSAIRDMEGQPFIQSDVAVDHGNSGGPLIDENGQVVGITDLGYAPDGISHNLNFFIPIGDALRSLVLTPEAAPTTASKAPTKVTRKR